MRLIRVELWPRLARIACLATTRPFPRPQADERRQADDTHASNCRVLDTAEPHGCECRAQAVDRKSTRLNSSHVSISYAVFCLKKKLKTNKNTSTKFITQ